MAGAPGTHVPLGQFHSGGHLATGPNWRQAAAATSLADRAFILEEYDPVAGSWASKGVQIDVSCGRIGVPFQVTNDDKVYVITLRTATEGTAAIGAEEVDIRLAPAVPSESLSASAASPMPDEIDTDDLMVAVRAAGDGAGAEGGTEPVVPVVSPVAAPAAPAAAGGAGMTIRRVWTPGRSAAATGQSEPLLPVPCLPVFSSQGDAANLPAAGPFHGLSAALRSESSPSAPGPSSHSASVEPRLDVSSPPRERPGHLRRLNYEGVAVPGSQTSTEAPAGDEALLIRGVQAMHLNAHDAGAAAAAAAAAVPGAPRPSFKRARDVASNSRVAPYTHATAVDTPDTSGWTPFRNGHLWCPWCDGRAFKSPHGLVRHITSMHAGSVVDERMRDTLVAVERRTCTGASCGGFRKAGNRTCNRCRGTTPARLPVVGDIIATSTASRSQPASQAPQTPDAATASSGDSATVDDGRGPVPTPVRIPPDFSSRVQRLSANTIVHIPISLRLRALRVARQCFNGIARGSEDWAILEEGRSKLIMAPIPEGESPAEEVERRLASWESGSLTDLLLSVERQQSSEGRKRLARAAPVDSDTRRNRRAKHIASEGAYRKATASVTSEMLQMSPEDDLACATLLLPSSSDSARALHPRADNRTVGIGEHDVRLGRGEDGDPSGSDPLDGVHYAKLTAPGPSGFRAEHLKEMLGVRRRAEAQSLRLSLARLHECLRRKAAPNALRWLPRTRLCWQKKKTGKPRPIKMGELLRTCYAKRFAKKHMPKLRKGFRQAHQWGIGVPGACEGLVHWRGTVEELAIEGVIEPVVAVDVDLVNMFGNAEWPQIRAALQDDLDEILAWTEWHHEEPAVTVLPSGMEFRSDCGAEQGDPFGSVQAGRCLGAARPRWASQDNGAAVVGACDEWFIDDGQAFVRPDLVDPWLRALDRAIRTFGGTRGTLEEENAKSSCRLLCPPHRRQEFEGWATEYVRASTKLLDSEGGATALGAPFGGAEFLHAEVQEVVAKAARTRAAIAQIDHAATEIVLTRQCADVAKLSYHLRLNGDRIQESALRAFDGDVRAAVEASLGGAVGDDSWMQACLGVTKGGLGLRSAANIALASFVASRVTSRPHVREMAGHLEEAGLATVAVVMRAYDDRTECALEALVSLLPSARGGELIDTVAAAAANSEAVWARLFDDEAAGPLDDAPRRPGPRGIGATLTPPDEDEDSEHPDNSGGSRAVRLQRLILAFMDEQHEEQLRNMHVAAGRSSAMMRLEELADPETDHAWLWHLSKHRGPVLQSDEYVEALRVRLGCAGPAEPVACALCNAALFDSAGAHAHCCSTAEATRGHHAVSREVLGVAKQLDPSSEHEAPGLIPGTRLRPADVLTGALGHGLTALDVGIASPDAQHAGDDCRATMYAEKVAYYAPHGDALGRQGIDYQPLIWSAYGRPHPRTTTILRTLSRKLARRRGCSDAERRYRRLRAAIATEIWRRAAKQVFACWPSCDDD